MLSSYMGKVYEKLLGGLELVMSIVSINFYVTSFHKRIYFFNNTHYMSCCAEISRDHASALAN